MNPGTSDRSTGLLGALMVLTFVSGLVDALSYLGLGHVFTANMTGNVVILGFAAAGAPGFSVLASLASLGSFLVGAVFAGRMCLYVSSRRRWLLIAMTTEAALAAGSFGVSASVGAAVSSGWPRYSLIVMLAFAMGVRNSTIRRLAIPDVTTTVLTLTLTGLAADSSLAGGSNPRFSRRTTSVFAMLAGAFVGAAIYLHQGASWLLALIAVVAAAITICFARTRASHELDSAEAT
jgi:uncharacterized membrane protein YoaK (UPF0700 family)